VRSIISLLSRELFGKSLAISDFPSRQDIAGIGLSDWNVMADALASKLNYRNTFFHQEPRLDITHIDESLHDCYDFIISSEVFEHVLAPPSRAFRNTYRLLRRGGVLILTVPYRPGYGPTIEHYPRLHDYKVVKGDVDVVIENITTTGERETFKNPVFHGGPGEALEMRIFSEAVLLRELKAAGFRAVEVVRDSDWDFGVYWKTPWSQPIVARK
jgi:SAM-dependent methyltransferase